jgi:C1A family cysteine protease
MLKRKGAILLVLGILLFWVGLAYAQPIPAPLNPKFLEFRENISKGIIPPLFTKSGHPLGLLPAPIDFSAINRGRIVSLVRQPLPSRYDLRQQGRLTPVKDQDGYGTCWAHATYGSLESCDLTETGKVWDFSENNLTNWAADNYDPVAPGQPFGWNGGTHLSSTAYLAGWFGPVEEVDDPYPNPGTWQQKTVRQHIQKVYFLPDRTGPLDNDIIKSAVMQYGAVYTTMYYDDAYFNPSTNAYYYSGSAYGNHAVCIVGWDDNYPKTNFSTQPSGDGAFIVRNSWGPSWGEGGYFYISYYDTQIGLENAVFTAGEEVTNYTNIYQYDPLGAVALLGYGSSTAWFANIFTAVSDEPISAVSFYVPVVNSSYTVYVYTSVTPGQPRSGTLAGSKSGTLPLPGYHTILLDVPVQVAQGQNFSVVVYLNTPGWNYPIPIEVPIAGYSSKATAHSGESFTSADGARWEDITVSYYNTNVCLKAFTGLPAFSGANFIPSKGTPSTLFTFSLLYNIPNKPLTFLKLHLANTITGKTFDSDMSSLDGKNYKTRIYLERGLYNFYFTASDGKISYRYPSVGEFTGPKVNTPPLLNNGKVEPSVGAPGDKFTFSVEYSDPDVDPAEYVKLHILQDGSEITGSPFTMTSKDGKLWTYSLTLYKAAGYKYSYKFSASDGIDETSTTAVEGPIVNNPPQLLNPQANPQYGQVGGKFTFSVTYKDIDGDQPQNVRLIITDPQGSELPPQTLEQEGNNPKLGIVFTAKDVVLNNPGVYTFVFEAEDGYVKVRSDKGSVGVGVIAVQASPEELDIIAQRGATIKISIAYMASQTLSLNITNPLGKVFSMEVDTDQNGLASTTLPTPQIPLDTLGTWKIEAKDKATGQSKGSASFVIKTTNKFPAMDMVSLPLLFTNTKVSDILKDQLSNLTLKWWDPAQGKYVDLSVLNTGQGFWMKIGSGTASTLNLYAGVLPSGETTVSLAKGWNIIGSSYTSDLDIGSVKVKYANNPVMSLVDADKAGLVRGYLWGYDPTTGDYILIHPALSGDNRTIKGWKGYWIRALQDGVQLVFTPATKSVETRDVKPEGWKVQLVVQGASGKDTCNYLGMGDSRLLSGVEEPPALSGVRLYFLRNGERLAWDVREKAERAEWDVVVEGAGEITLSWPNLSQLPKGYGLYLIDGDKRINMLTSSRYVFSSDGHKELKVIYERRASALLISGLMAKAVRGGVNVSFSLSDSAEVKVSVKGVDGRLIKEMTRSGVAGLNSVVWDGKDAQGKPLPAGVYLLEVVARSSDGSFVRGITMFNLR